MRRNAEDTVRSLGIFATYVGYFPLVDMVETLSEGAAYERQLWVNTARKYGISVKTLDTRIRRLMVCAQKNAPQRWQHWFGRERVSVESFLLKLAARTKLG